MQRLRPLRYTSPFQKRYLTHHIAVVGSGPSGFYTITELFKRQKKLNELYANKEIKELIELKITLFDKNPAPFGLSRYGVAPDHPEVKNCEDTFNESVNENLKNFKYQGNVNIGDDITINELLKKFNSVVLAYGNTKENKLGIEGEDHPKVINSKEFVAWYNSDPNINEYLKFQVPDLNKIKNVTIIGNGNVAMDVARILLMPVEKLENTDISNSAIEMLKKSSINEVNIIARRGILESKFTTKEIRELFELEQFGIKNYGIFPQELIKYIEPLLKKLERVTKRKFETILKFLKPINERKLKYDIPSEEIKRWSLQYLKTPIKINIKDENTLESILFQNNRIEKTDAFSDEVKIIPIKKNFNEIKTDLIITSVGFKGELIKSGEEANIKFDERRGLIVNKSFKVLNNEDEIINGLYTTGWISNNNKGPILNTFVSSSQLSEVIMGDVINNIENDIKHEENEIDIKFNKRIINWNDWNLLNEFEIKFGELNNKSRWKIPTKELMIEILEFNGSIDEKIKKFNDKLISFK